ncbi:hypothetical protein D3C81_2066760 [compost metagenome]
MPKQLRLLGADTAFDHIDITAVAINDLPAIAARSTKANPGRFQDRHPKPVLQQEQGAGQAGIAGANDADIRFYIIL